MSADLKALGTSIESLKRRIEHPDEKGDVYQSKNDIEIYEKNYKRLCEQLNDIIEGGESNFEKPLINKANQCKSDLEIILNILNCKKEAIKKNIYRNVEKWRIDRGR